MSNLKNSELYKEYNKIYGLQFTKKDGRLKQKTTKTKLTQHAKMRFAERFDTLWFTIKEILEDITKWWRTIRSWNQPWKFTILWKKWKYVINKDMTIITMCLLEDVKQ